jgi:hypothetical protein
MKLKATTFAIEIKKRSTHVLSRYDTAKASMSDISCSVFVWSVHKLYLVVVVGQGAGTYRPPCLTPESIASTALGISDSTGFLFTLGAVCCGHTLLIVRSQWRGSIASSCAGQVDFTRHENTIPIASVCRVANECEYHVNFTVACTDQKPGPLP